MTEFVPITSANARPGMDVICSSAANDKWLVEGAAYTLLVFDGEYINISGHGALNVRAPTRDFMVPVLSRGFADPAHPTVKPVDPPHAKKVTWSVGNFDTYATLIRSTETTIASFDVIADAYEVARLLNGRNGP